MKNVWPRPFVPPVGDPILPRLRHPNANFDWTFGGEYEPIFVDSGTTALRLAIETAVCHSGRSGTVWVPAYGCPDILAATYAAGATPVLYDTGADRPFFAAGQQAPANLIAAVAAHFLGLVHPPEDIAASIRQTGGLLIEDSAQRFPMPDDPFYGDAVVLSFGRGKPLSLMGGGCLLLKSHLVAAATRVAEGYQRRNLSRAVSLKCRLHDVAIRPSVFGYVRRVPGLGIGKVRYRAAPQPGVLGQRLRELASRAANAYQSETDWCSRQNRTVKFANQRYPQLVPLASTINQTDRRLSRLPFLAPNGEIARQIFADAFGEAIGASRMYERLQFEIVGAPQSSCGRLPWSRAFAQRFIAFPISTNR